jgi:cytochrome c oxidase subunit 3
MFHFVYHNSTVALLSLGFGTVLTVMSIVGWINEAIEDKYSWGNGYGFTAMPFFIVAEAFIFLACFVAYWVARLSAPSWPPVGSPEHMPVLLPIIMTVILVSSSVTIHFAEHKLEHGKHSGFVTWLIVSMVLGAVFLGISMNEWSNLIAEGFTVETNIFSTAFYSITGLHASHVIVGLGMFIFILIPALRGKADKTFVKAASMYWHFVDIIWFFVVSQIYFW